MDRLYCPSCRSSGVIHGVVVPQGRGGVICFIPPHLRALRWKAGISVHSCFFSCLSCGHLWTRISPDELRAFLAKHGTELTRQHVESLEAGPDHDLPDTPEARAAGRNVAEIDALVWEGKQNEATRRYRVLTAGTWDQAIDTIHHWHELERAEKLARFGWRPAAMLKETEAERREHPLHDRLLDG